MIDNDLVAAVDRMIYDRSQTFDSSELKVGDIIRLLWVRNYQHSATMEIIKVNNKTFKCQEIKGSYGGPREAGGKYQPARPGTIWIINKKYNYVKPSEDGRRDIFPNHYDHSR